jgi:hypothetical protein
MDRCENNKNGDKNLTGALVAMLQENMLLEWDVKETEGDGSGLLLRPASCRP